MQADRFTVKSQEALAAAARLAEERRNPQVVPLHLLAALTAPASSRPGAGAAPTPSADAPGGVVLPVLSKLGVDADALRATGDPGLPADMCALGDRLPELLDLLDRLPQTYAHGDASPQNLLLPAGEPGTIAVIDWGFGTLLPVGFDLGQLLVGLAHAGVGDLALLPAIDAAALLFLSALRPQIEILHPAAASACAMPRPIPPLPPVMTATRPVRSKIRASVSMRRFHLVLRALRLRPGAGRCSDTDHGQACPENQIWGRDIRSRCIRGADNAEHN